MSPRLRRVAAAPLVVAGACWFAAPNAALAVIAGPIPPCSPDNVCLPRRETWGTYSTHWRSWPGEQVHPVPTAAEPEPGKADKKQQREADMRGPQLPPAIDESNVGPKKPAKNALPSGSKAAEPAGAAPEDPAAPGGAAPPVQKPAVPGGPELPADPGKLPGAAPAGPGGEADPFGAARHNGRQRMALDKANRRGAPNAKTQSSADADAPPTLPAGLKQFSSDARQEIGRTASVRQPVAASIAQPLGILPANAAPPTPASMRADGRVTPTVAEAPLGIQLVNPAAALAPAEGEQGVLPAVYFEASDGEPAPLPTVE